MYRTAQVQAFSPLDSNPAGLGELPPTLQPGAIFHAAPARRRGLSLLLSLQVYGLLLAGGWVWMHRGPGAAPATMTFHERSMAIVLDESASDPPPGLMTAVQGRATILDSVPASAAVEQEWVPPDPLVPMALVPRESRDFPATAPPPQPGAVAGAAGPAGGAGHGSSAGPGSGRGLGKGSGRVMFKGVPGLDPGLDLNDLEVIHEEIPHYPMLAEWGHIQGDVVVRVTINEKGIPIRTELLEGPPALQSETMRAVKLWRFGRGIFRGKKLEATFDMTFRYILR